MIFSDICNTVKGEKRRQIRVERWLDQLSLDERESKGGGEAGEVEGVKGGRWGGEGTRRKERGEKQEKELNKKERISFEMVSQ